MSFESRATIEAPKAVVWDAVRQGWYDTAALNTPFEAGSSLETSVDIPDFLPEKLRRKLGDQLLVTVSLAKINHLHSLHAHVESGRHLPALDLSLFLYGDDHQTETVVSTSMDSKGSPARKMVGIALTPFIGPATNYALEGFKRTVSTTPPLTLPEAS